MNKRETKDLIRKVIKENCGSTFTKCAVRINGTVCYLSEREIRALQVAVIDMSDDEYNDFCNSVIIYNADTAKRSDGTITINKDGYLENGFHPGFYDVNDKLSLCLFNKQPILKMIELDDYDDYLLSQVDPDEERRINEEIRGEMFDEIEQNDR